MDRNEQKQLSICFKTVFSIILDANLRNSPMNTGVFSYIVYSKLLVKPAAAHKLAASARRF